MIDTMLGKYRILQRLGEGGMGTVYKARDELIDRIVAIKVLRPELTGNPQLLDRFRAEAVALARLNHPRIAILHGLEQNGSELYMVMEFLPGETVEKMIKRMARIPWVRAVEIASEILNALDHAHDMGVVHRDIKPANVMVSPSGGVKVMDFGIARITGRDRNTRVGHTVGTPVYMSPEQLRGEEVDGRADIYAVGGMLFEMVTGTVTFEADSDYDLMMKQLNEPPPVPGSIVPALPPALDDVIMRALAKRKEDRYVSAAAMQAALLALASSHRPTPATPIASHDDVKATRMVDAAPSGEVRSVGAQETRVATGPSVVVSSSAAVPLHRDWRTWVAAASVVIAVGLLVFSRGDDVTPASDATATVAGRVAPDGPRDSAPAVASASGRDGGFGGVVGAPRPDAGGGAVSPSLPTNIPVAASPDTTIAPPVTSAPTTTAVPPRNNPPPSTSSTRPPSSGSTAKAPPRTSGSNARPGTSATVPPAVARDTTSSVAPPTRPPAREPSASLSRDAATSAAGAFLALLGNRNADAFGSAIGGTGSYGALLTAVREGRVSAAAPSDVSVSDGGAVSFSTTLTWRTPFGANRRGTMRVAGTAVQDGGSWRMSRARLVEVPDVK